MFPLKPWDTRRFRILPWGFRARPSASIMGSMASSKDKPWTGLAISSIFRIPEMLSYDIWAFYLTTWGTYHYVMDWNLKPTQTKLNVQKPYLESQTILWEETRPGTKRINQHHMGGKTRTHKRKHCKNHRIFRNSTISLQDYRIQYVWYQILSHP